MIMPKNISKNQTFGKNSRRRTLKKLPKPISSNIIYNFYSISVIFCVQRDFPTLGFIGYSYNRENKLYREEK